MWEAVIGVVVLLLVPTLPLHSNSEVREYDLATVCGSDGSKKSLFLGSLGAMVFNYNSSVRTKLDCHLEVHHKIQSDRNLGFHVFIDWMDLDSTDDCSRDSLQYGRDKLFITDRTSKKFCGQVPSPHRVEDEEGRVVRWDMVTSTSRTWIEETDFEFDIWLTVFPSPRVKGLRLIVTPFRKTCSLQDPRQKTQYARCANSQRCFTQDSFCRGLVKCGALERDTWDRACSSHSTADSPLQLPLAIIIAVFAVIAVTFLGLGARMVYQYFTGGVGAGRSSSESSQGRGARCGQGRGRESLALRSVAVSPSTPLRAPQPRMEGRDDSGLPAQPPSYSEAVESGAVWKDDPPKYSDIEH